jgi:hypothetical protein
MLVSLCYWNIGQMKDQYILGAATEVVSWASTAAARARTTAAKRIVMIILLSGFLRIGRSKAKLWAGDYYKWIMSFLINKLARSDRNAKVATKDRKVNGGDGTLERRFGLGKKTERDEAGRMEAFKASLSSAAASN